MDNYHDENDIFDGKSGRNRPTLFLGGVGPMQIWIETLIGVTMTLKVESSSTIGDIVTMIRDKLGIPQYLPHTILVHGEEVINGKSSVDDCHIEMGSTLLFFVARMQEILAERRQEGVVLVQDHHQRRRLFTQRQFVLQKLFIIKWDDGKTLALEVKTSDTIIDVRIQIQRELHIPLCMQKLFFAEEEELEDDFTLADYYIHNESTLRLKRRPQKYILVLVKSTGSKTTRLEVEYSDTIHNMKAKIYDNIPLDQLTLLLDGKQLDDTRTLADYGVNRRCTLYLVLDGTIADCYIHEEPTTFSLLFGSMGPMKILVKILTEKKIKLEVNRCDTIAKIKAKIEDKEGVPSCEQRLLFLGKQLEDSLTIADCCIYWYSVIHLIHEYKGMKINITTLSGNNTISLQVDSSDTVGHLKAKIKDEEGISLDNHGLLFTGKQLQDSRTLADYNICNNSILQLVHRLH